MINVYEKRTGKDWHCLFVLNMISFRPFNELLDADPKTFLKDNKNETGFRHVS